MWYMTDRMKTELLIALWRLLNKQEESKCILNLLETTVDFAGKDCSGSELMEEIMYSLKQRELIQKIYCEPVVVRCK